MLVWESVMPQSVSGMTLPKRGPDFPAAGWTMKVRLNLLQPELQSQRSTKRRPQGLC
jgi:hypothetical protein